MALAMLISWRLGGDRFAQGLTGLAVLVMPIYLGIDSILSTNAFEPLFWMGGVYLLIRILQGDDSRRWLGIGVLLGLGLGLENKHSTAFFGFALASRPSTRCSWPRERWRSRTASRPGGPPAASSGRGRRRRGWLRPAGPSPPP